MDDMTLEYSWSDGKYWSQYNHCRVWENGTYNLKVRDKYGQTSTTTYEVTNNHKATIEPPTIKGTTGIIENVFTANSSAGVIFTPPIDNLYIDYKIEGAWYNGTWTLGTSKGRLQMGPGMAKEVTITARCRDDYGNLSQEVTFVLLRDTTAPTNINFVPTVSIANEIYTTVSAIENEALPLRYSITYDGGQTWSEPQIGRNFGLVNNPPKGTYTINCRAYNAAGLYVEGSPVQVTIE